MFLIKKKCVLGRGADANANADAVDAFVFLGCDRGCECDRGCDHDFDRGCDHDADANVDATERPTHSHPDCCC